MEQLAGKTAFVTGGASGIGLALVRAFVAEGMQVAIADVDAAALDAAVTEFAGSNAAVAGWELDVTDRARFKAVADEVEGKFGAVHLVCNNAGVYRGGSIDAVTYSDWDWVMGVNVGGVVNGVQTWVERIKAHGEGGHIVNTASMAGIVTSPGLGVYNTSKFAVVGMSEAMRTDLEPQGIGVSVLCPGMVRTQILDSERTRPTEYEPGDEKAEAAAAQHSEIMQMAMNASIGPEEVADLVVRGVRENQLYLFPHPELKASAEARAEAVLNAFGEADPQRLAAQEAFMAQLLEQPS
ncbi:MAG: SDR family NAD(P)-dependent oxidoreductase [Pseudomonadota bacterium]